MYHFIFQCWDEMSSFMQLENIEARKQNYWERYYFGVNEGKGRGKKHLSFSVHVFVCTPYYSFSLFYYLPSHQGSTLSILNFVTYPLCFLIAYKMTSRPSVSARASDSKNPDLYYYCFGAWFNWLFGCLLLDYICIVTRLLRW